MIPQRTLCLAKRSHVFSIKYEIGSEHVVLDAIIDMVNNENLDFDWRDASVMAYFLGQRLAREIKSGFTHDLK